MDSLVSLHRFLAFLPLQACFTGCASQILDGGPFAGTCRTFVLVVVECVMLRVRSSTCRLCEGILCWKGVGRRPEVVVVECVMPDFLHAAPIRDDTVLDRQSRQAQHNNDALIFVSRPGLAALHCH